MDNEIENKTATPTSTANNTTGGESENWQNILKEFSQEAPAVETATIAPDAQSVAPSPAPSASSFASADNTETINFSDFSNTTSSYVVKPYKKKNVGLIVLIIVLIVAALGSVGYYLYTQDLLPFLSKKADYEAAERSYITEALDTVDSVRGGEAINYNTADFTLKVTPSAGFAQMLGAETLNETTFNCKGSLIGDKSSMTAEYINGSDAVIQSSFYKDGNKSYIYIPQLSDKYMLCDEATTGMLMTSGLSGNPSQEIINKLTAIDTSRFDASVAAVLDSYFDSLGEVKDYTKEKVTVGELESEYTCANVEITDKIAYDTIIALLNELLKYPELTEFTLADFCDPATVAALEGSASLNDKLSTQIQSLIDILNIYKSSSSEESTNPITMKVYLDNKNKIVGRTIIIPSASTASPSNVSISFMEATSGSKSAQLISLTASGTSFSITNNCTNNNGTYTGKTEITTGEDSFNAVISYENLKEDNGFVTGTVTISVPQMASQVKITLDALVNNNQFIEIAVNMMGVDCGKISIDTKVSKELDVVIPEISDSNTVDMMETTNSEEFMLKLAQLSQQLAAPANGHDLISILVSSYLTSTMTSASPIM